MRLTILTVIVSSFLMSQAFADVKQIKSYKEAFPGEAPKCMLCHVDKLPKKDDGKHELNDYGKKIIAENAKPTAETYLKVGKPEVVQEGDQSTGKNKDKAVAEGQGTVTAGAGQDVEEKADNQTADKKADETVIKTEKKSGK